MALQNAFENLALDSSISTTNTKLDTVIAALSTLQSELNQKLEAGQEVALNTATLSALETITASVSNLPSDYPDTGTLAKVEQVRALLASTLTIAGSVSVDENLNYTNSFAPNPVNYITNDTGKKILDAAGNLIVRAETYSDAGSFREDFSGTTSETALTGTLTFSNVSTSVTGSGTLFLSELKGNVYVKLTASADTEFRQIDYIESDTVLYLKNAPITSGSGASVWSAVWIQLDAGVTKAVANSKLTVSMGTTALSNGRVSRLIDYSPLVCNANISVSQRILNQDILIGLDEHNVAISRWYARFRLNGTSNTTVITESARVTSGTPTGADIETNTITLPNAVTTASALDYRIESDGSKCNFYIDNILVATHAKHIPDVYDNLGFGVVGVNGTTPASNTDIVIDLVNSNNYNNIAISNPNGNQQVTPLDKDLYFIGQSAQTATVNNIIPSTAGAGGTDVSGFSSGSIQIVSTGTGGTFVFEGSNNNVNFQTMTVWNSTVMNGTATFAAITASASSNIYIFPTNFRYIRVRIATTITGGSIQAFTSIKRANYTGSATQIAQSVSGNLNVTIGGGALGSGSNAIGDVGIQYRASSTGAGVATNLNSPATPAIQTIKGTSGRLLGVYVVNSNAATRYLKVFNAASPTLGTTASILDIAIPPNSVPVFIKFEGGISFAAPIQAIITGARGTTDNTAITLNDVTGFTVHA